MDTDTDRHTGAHRWQITSGSEFINQNSFSIKLRMLKLSAKIWEREFLEFMCLHSKWNSISLASYKGHYPGPSYKCFRDYPLEQNGANLMFNIIKQ